MDERQLGGEARVGQVGEERLELARGEHALVDDGRGRERREVDVGLVLGALAQAEGEAVQLDARPGARSPRLTKSCSKCGMQARGGTDEVGVDGHLAPAEDLEVLLGGDLLDPGLGGARSAGSAGRKAMPAAYAPALGRVNGTVAEERVGDLGEDAGPVADAGVGAGGTAVVEVAQGGEGVLDDVVPAPSRIVAMMATPQASCSNSRR